MEYVDDPNFVQNNFGNLRDSTARASNVTHFSSTEKVKRVGFASSTTEPARESQTVRFIQGPSTTLTLRESSQLPLKESSYVTFKEVTSPSNISREQVMMLIEENTKMKDLVEQLLSKLKQVDPSTPRVLMEKDRRIAELELVLKELRSQQKIEIVGGSDEGRVQSLMRELERIKEESSFMKLSIEEWRKKVEILEGEKEMAMRKYEEVRVEMVRLRDEAMLVQELKRKVFVYESQQGERIGMDERRVEGMEKELMVLRQKVSYFESQPTKVVEKIVEKPIEVIKYIDRPFEKIVERRVEVPIETIKYVDRTVEKRVEVPVEVVKFVDRPVEKRVEVPVERIQYIERPVERIVEKRVEVPTIQYIEKPVDRIVEKRIEVPVDRIQYIEKPVERIVEKVDDRKVRELEMILRDMREENMRLKSTTSVEKVVVDDRKVRELEIIIQNMREEIIKLKATPSVVVDDRKVRELEMILRDMREENIRLKATLDEWRGKLIAFEQEKVHSEKVKKSVHQDVAGMDAEIQRLRRELEILRTKEPEVVERVVEKIIERPPEIIEKIVEKIIEKPVPFEVVKEKVVVDDRALREFREKLTFSNEELRRLSVINEELSKKVYFLENQPPMILEKRVEVPVEVLKETIVMADDKVLREYEQEVNFQKAENRKMKVVIDEWKARVADLELQLSREKVVERKVEVPVVREKIVLDEVKTGLLEKKLFELGQENLALKGRLDEMGFRLVKYEEERVLFEKMQRDSVNYENEIMVLKKEINRLVSLVGPEVVRSQQPQTQLISTIIMPDVNLPQNNQERVEVIKKSGYKGNNYQQSPQEVNVRNSRNLDDILGKTTINNKNYTSNYLSVGRPQDDQHTKKVTSEQMIEGNNNLDYYGGQQQFLYETNRGPSVGYEVSRRVITENEGYRPSQKADYLYTFDK